MITNNISEQISSMTESADTSVPSLNDSGVFTGEDVNVAGVGFLKKIGKGVAKEAVKTESEAVKKALEPLQQKRIKEGDEIVQERAKAVREPAITPVKRTRTPKAEQPETVPQVDEIKPLTITPKSDEAMQEIVDLRKQSIEEGTTNVAPSPTALQAEQGVTKSVINTLPFDDAELQSTIKTTAEALKGTGVQDTVTLGSLYNKMSELGMPQSIAKSILRGEPLESKIGNNELALTMTAVAKLHDDSAVVLDELFYKLENDYNNFTEIDRFNLGQQAAYHENIVSVFSGAGTDLARAMNTLKRIKDQAPILKQEEFSALLDGSISKAAMLKMAKAYNNSSTRAGKNKLIKNQKGIFTKVGEMMMYTFQSNILNDIGTYATNIYGGLTNGAFIDAIDTFAATSIGKIRGKFGANIEDVPEYEDLINGYSGFYNGILDGLENAKNVLMTGKRSDFKGEVVENPITAKYLSDTSIATIFGKEFRTSKDLEKSPFGQMINGVGVLQSIPLRAIGSIDEVISTTVARTALHREASKFARKSIKDRVNAGMSYDDAAKATAEEVSVFLREQPADIYMNVEEIRQMSNFTYKFNKHADSWYERSLAGNYDKLSRLFDIPGAKIIQPFAGTLTKIFDQGASRIPGANLISPQFWKDWNRGGHFRDRAIARVSTGAALATASSMLAMENKVTGNGPGAKEDRDALMAMGWRPRSLVVSGDISEQNRKRISDLNVDWIEVGEGVTYIDYGKMGLTPLSEIFTFGADFSDAMKFYGGSPDSTELSNFALVGVGSLSETVSNLPAMEFVGELISIMRGRHEDGGEKVVQVLEKLATQAGKFTTLAIPGVSLPASSAGAHIARLIDPLAPAIRPEMTNPNHAQKVYENVRNTFISRIPSMRGEFNADLDNAGRPKFNKDTYLQSYWNLVPRLSVVKGNWSEMDAVLAANEHGINTPSTKMRGVEMSEAQYNRYKDLYGQKIKIEHTLSNGETVKLNMEKAIPAILKDYEIDRQQSGLPPLDIGDKKTIIDSTIAMYREVARKIMIGELVENDETKELESFPFDGTDYGYSEETLEFPELRDEILKANEFKRKNG